MQRESLKGSCQIPLQKASQLQLELCRLSSSSETSTGKTPNHFTLFLHSVCVVFSLHFAEFKVVFFFFLSLLQLLITDENHFFFSFFSIGNTISAAEFWKLNFKPKICSEIEYWFLSYQWLFMQRYGHQLVEQFTVSQTLGMECFMLNEKWHLCTEKKMNTENFPVDMQSNSR